MGRKSEDYLTVFKVLIVRHLRLLLCQNARKFGELNTEFVFQVRKVKT